MTSSTIKLALAVILLAPALTFAQANQPTQDLWMALKEAAINNVEITAALKSSDMAKRRAVFAAQERINKAIEQSIAAGADVDFVAPDGTSAWSHITAKNLFEANHFLVKNSKGLGKIKVNGLSPLLHLFQLKHDFTGPDMERLLGKGADPNDKFPDGKSALDVALETKKREKMGSGTYTQAITALVVAGADVRQRSTADQFFLWKLGHSDEAYYKALKNQGLSSEIKDPEGCTPLILAAKSKDTSAVEALLKVGVNANAVDHAGNTALMYVAQDFYISDTIKAFVAAGGDLNIRNKKSQTAGDIYRSLPEVKKAIKEGYQEYADRENQMIDTAKLFPDIEKIGPAVGKVFSVDGKKIEITGQGIDKLAKGKTVIIRSSTGNVKGKITDVLHTKAKARITGASSVAAGDAVHLAP